MKRAAGPPSPDEARSRLLDFYDREARDLPWRREKDPYRILVSEVMLQQTRVATVERYYGPWLDRFPDVATLSAADEDDVLKAWEGLGYYRRARNLHRAAQLLVREHGGEFPRTAEGLRALPGVGEYSSGAVASIAFGEAVPAVDGNVRRVLSRWYAEAVPTAKWLRERAAELVDPGRPGDWNQALMELGATVCTPTSPRCADCPMTGVCAAAAEDQPDRYPAPVKRKAVSAATFATAVFTTGDKVLVMKRPEQGLLAGMWSFPELTLGSEAEVDAALEALAEALSLRVVARPVELPSVRHRFTHLDATYRPYLVEVVRRESAPGGDGDDRSIGEGATAWLVPGDATPVALPKAQQKILESIPALERASA